MNSKKLFVISDMHYGHKNIIEYCKRPFETVNEMNEIMRTNWNNTVGQNDVVINIGDLSANIRTDNQQEELKKYLLSLNGTKILLRGNHDHFSDDFYKQSGFRIVQDYMSIGKYFICHYPIYTESKYSKPVDTRMKKIFNNSECTEIIHGHTHNNQGNVIKSLWKDKIPRYNCSVEVINFTPIPFEDLIKN